MQLPFSIADRLPTWDDLHRPRTWALAGIAICIIAAAVVAIGSRWPRPAAVPVADATLTITSSPPDAVVLVGGEERGHTPATLAVPAGESRVTLRLADHADVTYTVRLATGQSASLAGVLWPRTPEARRVRPSLPGATIAGANFLADGRLALDVALPQSDEHQLWIVERDGGARRVGPPLARGAVAASPDGGRVAYLARSAATASPGSPLVSADEHLNEVWVTGRDGDRGERRYALPLNTADERLVWVGWAPDGERLLLVGQLRPQGGGLRTRLLLLDLATAGAAPRELISLPSEVVPGAFAWSPRGDRVALLARAAGRTTLCLVSADGTSFRSLADLGGDAAPPFPPLSWAAGAGDGIAYAAPDPAAGPASGGLGTRPPALFVEDRIGQAARRVGEATGPGSGWRSDGLILALTRPKANGPVLLRAFDPTADAAGQDLGAPPLPPGALAGTRWDLAHDQALVALRGGAGGAQPDLWLVSWRGRGAGVAR